MRSIYIVASENSGSGSYQWYAHSLCAFVAYRNSRNETATNIDHQWLSHCSLHRVSVPNNLLDAEVTTYIEKHYLDVAPHFQAAHFPESLREWEEKISSIYN